MFEIVCVTNRRLCKENFLTRVELLAAAHPSAIILREKDLSEAEYRELARKAVGICNTYGVKCILHTFVNVAKELNTPIHLSVPTLRSLSEREREGLQFGVSCHSAEEAVEAERLGASYITAGHIFDTDCKKGLPGRGTDFLKEVCSGVKIPVYAIGGIDADNIVKVANIGCRGACVMSGAMTAEDVNKYITELKHR